MKRSCGRGPCGVPGNVGDRRTPAEARSNRKRRSAADLSRSAPRGRHDGVGSPEIVDCGYSRGRGPLNGTAALRGWGYPTSPFSQWALVASDRTVMLDVSWNRPPSACSTSRARRQPKSGQNLLAAGRRRAARRGTECRQQRRRCVAHHGQHHACWVPRPRPPGLLRAGAVTSPA